MLTVLLKMSIIHTDSFYIIPLQMIYILDLWCTCPSPIADPLVCVVVFLVVHIFSLWVSCTRQ